MVIAIDAINYQVANSTDACERKSIFPSPFFSDTAIPSAEKHVHSYPKAAFNLLCCMSPKHIASLCTLLSAGFYRCQSLTLCIASVQTLSQNHQQRHQTLNTTQYSNRSFVFPADLCFSDRIAHFCFCLP